jgi:two-component system chemotaxis sensor kinase CheA
VSFVEEAVGGRGARVRERADLVRRTRGSLGEALRLIGPPRPWGAPALALRRIEEAASQLAWAADDLDASGAELEQGEQHLRQAALVAKRELSAMRQTTLEEVARRVVRTVQTEAARLGRRVAVRASGLDASVDRSLVEALIESCVHLARNAVAHGIEAPEERRRLGKPDVGTVTLTAKRARGRLSFVVADDGAGVDPERVRAAALASGVLDAGSAELLDEEALLGLLFLPGLSTAASRSDVLAGRGLGLDIAQSVARRLGGVVRVSSRRGEGFAARIDVPLESGLVRVLWTTAAGAPYALPGGAARRVSLASDDERAPHLASILTQGPAAIARYVVELDAEEEPDRVRVGVDHVGRAEEVLVRALPPLVASMGPYAGAVLRADGALALVVDVPALAFWARRRAAQAGRQSYTPGR